MANSHAWLVLVSGFRFLILPSTVSSSSSSSPFPFPFPFPSSLRFSKEKVSGQKQEGRVHDDMWVLPLKPLLATAGDKGGASGGRVVLDAAGFGSKATWQKISKKGQV